MIDASKQNKSRRGWFHVRWLKGGRRIIPCTFRKPDEKHRMLASRATNSCGRSLHGFVFFILNNLKKKGDARLRPSMFSQRFRSFASSTTRRLHLDASTLCVGNQFVFPSHPNDPRKKNLPWPIVDGTHPFFFFFWESEHLSRRYPKSNRHSSLRRKDRSATHLSLSVFLLRENEDLQV